MERYVLELPASKLRPMITFITCNHKLAVEVGRNQNIDRNLRNCDLCKLDILRDEYHLLMECTNNHTTDMRVRCIPSYYRNRPNMAKFSQLMLNVSNQQNLAIKVANFLEQSKTL